MNPTIRAATPADARTLAELRHEFRAPRSANVESKEEFVGRCTEWMRSRLSSDTWRCWVAEREGRIVGHVWLHLIEKIPNPVAESEWHGYITNLYVREGARGGTGSALMDEALAWCATRDVDSIVLWPTERSRTLYGRKGFSVNDALMSRESRPPHA
jgi:GNAT superfamily N-acetyltransferase